MKVKTTIGLLMLVAILCSPVWAETITFKNGLNGYDGTLDSGARQESGRQNYNYGACPVLGSNFEGTDQEQVSFFNFTDIFGTGANQIPEGQTITSAKLGLYVVSMQNAGSSRQVSAYAMKTRILNYGTKNSAPAGTYEVCWLDRGLDKYDWGDGTQRNGPEADADYYSTAVDTVTMSATGSYVEFDVTAVIRGWYDESIKGYGFLIRGSEMERLTSYSSSEGSYKPYLEVTYTPEPATMSLLLLGGGLALLKRKSA